MNRKMEICTTYNKEYYDKCGKAMIETFAEFYPQDITLHVYYQEQEPEIIKDNIVYHDLYTVQPQLKAWVDEAKKDPAKCGWRADRGKWVWKKDGVKFSHKAFAQSHRIKNSTADFILYSDADTLYVAPPDMDMWNECMPVESLCSFFYRTHRWGDETGFYMHNPKHPKALDWANRIEEVYLSGEVWTHEENRAADQYTMPLARQSFLECTQTDLGNKFGLQSEQDPVPLSPLKSLLKHNKGKKKNNTQDMMKELGLKNE